MGIHLCAEIMDAHVYLWIYLLGNRRRIFGKWSWSLVILSPDKESCLACGEGCVEPSDDGDS